MRLELITAPVGATTQVFARFEADRPERALDRGCVAQPRNRRPEGLSTRLIHSTPGPPARPGKDRAPVPDRPGPVPGRGRAAADRGSGAAEPVVHLLGRAGPLPQRPPRDRRPPDRPVAAGAPFPQPTPAQPAEAFRWPEYRMVTKQRRSRRTRTSIRSTRRTQIRNPVSNASQVAAEPRRRSSRSAGAARQRPRAVPPDSAADCRAGRVGRSGPCAGCRHRGGGPLGWRELRRQQPGRGSCRNASQTGIWAAQLHHRGIHPAAEGDPTTPQPNSEHRDLHPNRTGPGNGAGRYGTSHRPLSSSSGYATWKARSKHRTDGK